MLIDTMQGDPLYLRLIIILMIGTITALLFTLVGNLLASWLNVRTRLASFAVLRALGTSPVEITGILLWEQMIIYTTEILLGCIFGAVISVTAVPALAFTSVPATGILSSISIDEFYALQYILPAQVVVPLSLGLAFITLVAVCLIALGIMAIAAVHSSMSKTLRLNED